MTGRRRRRLAGARGPAGPWVLGFETGGEHLSVALLRLPAVVGDAAVAWRLVDEVAVYRGHRHADSVMVLVDRILWRHGLAPTEIALIASGRGPGGFTGIRVGLATAVGLGLGTGAVIWPVCSLSALASHAATRPGLVVPLLDAKKGEVYGAAFRVPAYGAVEVAVPPTVGACDTLMTRVSALAPVDSITCFGSGALQYRVATPGVPPAWHVGAARHIAWLAAVAWEAAGRDANAAPAIDPAYLRPSDAEIGLLARKAATPIP